MKRDILANRKEHLSQQGPRLDLSLGARWRSCTTVANGIGAIVTALVIATPGAATGQPAVPGFTVETYATAPVHQISWISFDESTGTLYAGRDGSSSGEPLRIYRVGPGGMPIEEYGDEIIADPDTVLFDAAGIISGVAGSVLVGGSVNGGTGKVSAIRPDETITTIWELSSLINPTEMAFDSTGRVLVGDNSTGTVQVSATGETPSTLFTIPSGPVSLAVGGADRIYTVAFGDRVPRIHNANGSVFMDPFIDLPGSFLASVVIGPGGLPWGRDAYFIDKAAGELLRVNDASEITVIGTGFETYGDTEFGPDGALYVVDNDSVSKIIRIAPAAPIPTVSERGLIVMVLLTLTAGVSVLSRRRIASHC